MRHRGFPRAGVAVLFAALLAALAACGSGSSNATETPLPTATPIEGALTVRAFEWGFGPQEIELKRGEQVQIVLVNDGGILHNLKVGDLAADGIESSSSGPLSADEGELFVGADDGEQGTLAFEPLGAGTFTFYCTISGHRTLGMEGVVTVTD